MSVLTRLSPKFNRTFMLAASAAAMMFAQGASAQNVDCVTCNPAPDCPCPSGTPFGCNIPAGIGCTDPGGCTGAPGTCLFVPGAPLAALAGSAEAEEAGRRLVCAIRFALANNVPQVYVCGQYSILQADEFGTDVSAFKKIGAGRVLTVAGRSSNAGDAVIRTSPNAAAPRFRFFFVEDGGSLTLENLTLQDGRADFVTNSSGGAVFVESTQSGMGLPSIFEASNCAFTNNFARADGGAVRFEDGNRDPNEGSPLEARCFFRLTNCTFTDNLAQQQGGGVATSDITIVEGCTFTGNRAGAAGPAATGLGGGFWAGPRAIGGGSGSAPVFMRSSTAPALATTFVNNVAGEGGGMFARGPGERQLTSVEFRGNQAQSALSGTGETGGGAFHGELSDRVTMFACIFGGPNPGEPNFTTQADGGAVLSESTNMEIVNSLFFNNSAVNVGGAGRMTGSQRSLYRQCTIQGNSAPSGGGVYVDNNADVAFDDCIFRSNVATGPAGGGGALFLGGGRPFIYNCTMTANQAATGAGIFNNGAGTAILHTTIADIRGTGRAVQFGSKPSDPVVIQNSIIGDLWTLPIADQAFSLPLPQQVVVRFTDVEVTNIAAFNATPGYGGNINCDPLFANVGAGDVHLTQCSPCIDRAFEQESDNIFAGVINESSQWFSLLSTFFQPCSQIGGHCRGDYDDNSATDDVSPADGLSDRDGNPVITDSPAIAQTPRRSECQSDMGADESTTSITADLTVACRTRAPGNSNSNDCSNVGTLINNPTCGYCIGDDAFLVPDLNSTCPGEFVVTWYRRNPSIPSPCPPTTIPAPGDIQLPSGSLPNVSVLADGTLCINDATPANSGCYYAVATRQSCGDTQPPPPEFELFGVCASQVAACACITIGTPPAISAQPQPSMVCDGTPTAISVTAAGSGGPLCYQWYRRDTPCTGPGSGGTPINGANSPTLSFLPARARCPGEAPDAQDDNGYYYVVVSYCNGGGSGECDAITSDCARLSVFCPPAITGGGSAIVCGGGTAGGEQDCCYVVTAPQGCVPTITWYKDLGVQGNEGDDIIVSTGSPAGVTIVTVPLGNDQFQTCIVWNLAGLTPAQANALAGNYYMKAHCADAACSTRSANCTLTVRPQPTISLNPEDAAVCEGSPQCFSATVAYTGTTGLCWEWRAKPMCGDVGDGTLVASGAWTLGQPLVFTHCIDSAQAADEQCYFFRIRVCAPDDLDKCPWVASGCGCLDVRPQLIACELPCESGITDSAGNCLFCPGSNILLCCDVASADGPICYQWQRQTAPNVGVWVDIVGQTAACLEIRSFDPSINATCYRVRINYADLSGPNCPETSERCDAVYSNAICLAPTAECCEIPCPCKDNADEVQEVYSVWHTGDWDGVNGEWSFDRATTDGASVKAADDFFLCPSAVHRLTTFTGKMLVKQSNPSLELHARLRFYTDCNGAPGELIEEFESECAAFIEAAPEGFNLFQFQFFFECFWLKGGAYWVSLAAVAPTHDPEFEAFWVSAGLPGSPPTPTVMGVRPLTMDGDGPWEAFDACCHPCTDLQFCLIGESCPIMWDNGRPDLGGADDAQPGSPPFIVFGTRSEKSTLTPRNSRAADQLVIKTCAPEEVCYLEGYIFTNCLSFEAHLEIYENDCREPDFALPGGTPYYQRIADQVIDLEYDGLFVGGVAVRAYKVFFCDWPQPLIFEPGKNYWVSLSVRDTFSAAERAYFAHVRTPCDPCTSTNIWKIDPGMELAPGRQVPDWTSVGADFAFLIATKKHHESGPVIVPPPGNDCFVDVNRNGVADVADIFEFLSIWFAGCP